MHSVMCRLKPDLKADDSTKATGHLRLCNAVVRVRWQARVVHARDHGVRFQPLRQLHCCLHGNHSTVSLDAPDCSPRCGNLPHGNLSFSLLVLMWLGENLSVLHRYSEVHRREAWWQASCDWDRLT